ncbi:MAG: tRNA 2-thiouridine(34) synthase MnmA [Clostridia bacterium]|nr:tRNA 2-thiouridine(34) synthase MnmA [Clostridia bacterium]
MKKAMIAMSGGVDSSVAAYLITKQGYDAIGVTMKLFHNEDIGVKSEKTCCSLDDVNDARSVAHRLGIPYYVFNYTDNFKLQVITRFVEAYRNGRTPNPCIDCNRYIKFDQLMQRAKELQFDYVVTGHYAITEYDEKSGRYLLKKAVDETKDQSYVLYSLTQEQLKHILFPLGSMTKAEARVIAEEQGFVNAQKHDSQDICFVPDGNYARFIEEWCGFKFENGNFVDLSGNIIAQHKGIINYTIGQRKGLGIAAKAPYYVVSKNLGTNEVVLGANEDLFSDSLIATDVNFISIENLTEPMHVKAKVRYKQKETDAVITPLENGDVSVKFETPQRAIAPGQAVVFYDGDIVVGGGTIV